MSSSISGDTPIGPGGPSPWMVAIAEGLLAAGHEPAIHGSETSVDIKLTIRVPGRREAEIIFDDDGYAELRWWTDLSASAADVAAHINRAIAAVVSIQPVIAPDEASEDSEAGISAAPSAPVADIPAQRADHDG